MNTWRFHFQLRTGIVLIFLAAALISGAMAAHSYSSPGFLKDYIGFVRFRPMHTAFVLGWIILAALVLVRQALRIRQGPTWLLWFQSSMYLLYGLSVLTVFSIGSFGGREYWELPLIHQCSLHVSVLIDLVFIVNTIRKRTDAPVYMWMWATGVVFIGLTLLENNLWRIGAVFTDQVRDMTIQWKAAGSLVGGWNQLIYGLGLWLISRLSGSESAARSRMAWLMYFLGLFNLMFNWGHHIYTLPTAPYVRIISYAVSMTEWIILLRIIGQWKRNSGGDASLSGKLLRYADRWVFFNLVLALLMSVPAINLFTHGTQITVAHSMGTTIGINTFFLLAVIVHLNAVRELTINWVRWSWNLIRWLFPVFWLSLIASGVIRGLWQMQKGSQGFQGMMQDSYPVFRIFMWTGSLFMLGMILFIAGIWKLRRR